MHIFALNLMLSLESNMDFDLLWPSHLLSSRVWLFPSIIRMVFSSEVFGVFVTTRYLVLFIWVDEIYSYFTQFSLIISSIPCLFLLYLSWYTIRTSNMTLYELVCAHTIPAQPALMILLNTIHDFIILHHIYTKLILKLCLCGHIMLVVSC